MIGLSPIIAAASRLDRGVALGLGIALTSLVVCGISRALGGRIPERLRGTMSLAAAGGFSGLYGLALLAWSPSLATGLGIFIPLIAVNGLVIHAVEEGWHDDLSGTRGVFRSVAGYFTAIVLIAATRELLGSGSLSLPVPGFDPMRIGVIPVPIIRLALTPAGGFLLLGLIAAAWRAGLRAMGRIVR